jgi:thiol-disulfide isomerase/thioredoxin
MTIRLATCISLIAVLPSPWVAAKDRTTDEMKQYAERRMVNADEQKLTAFVGSLDQDGDGTITDAEFARRIEVFQQVFETVRPVPTGGGHDLPENWMTDFEKAREKSVETGKPVLVMFSASWCGPCKAMIANVYPTPEAKEALEAFVPVYVDAEKEVELASKNNIRAFPTFVCFDPQGKAIGEHIGGGSVDDFLTMLQSFLAP